MEKPPIKPKGSRFGAIVRNRKLLAAVSLLGGLFILKVSGCLEGKSAEPEVKKPAMAEQAPNLYKSQQKVREALLIALNQKQEPALEIQVPDDVGFGGPDPEEEKDNNEPEELNVSVDAKAFLLLPVGAVEGILQSYDLENTLIMGYVKALKELQDVIQSEDTRKIQKTADEILKQAEYLQSEEGMAKLGNWKKRFKQGNRKEKRKGKARLKFVIDTFMGSLSYVKLLAGR